MGQSGHASSKTGLYLSHSITAACADGVTVSLQVLIGGATDGMSSDRIAGSAGGLHLRHSNDTSVPRTPAVASTRPPQYPRHALAGGGLGGAGGDGGEDGWRDGQVEDAVRDPPALLLLLHLRVQVPEVRLLVVLALQTSIQYPLRCAYDALPDLGQRSSCSPKNAGHAKRLLTTAPVAVRSRSLGKRSRRRHKNNNAPLRRLMD